MDLNPTITYLSKFFESHISGYQQMLLDAGGTTYPEMYVGRNEAIKMIRDMVHGIQEEFSKMDIPQGYSSPSALLQRLVAYRDLGQKYKKSAENLNAAIDHDWPHEIDYAHKISAEVGDAIAHALTLSNLPTQRATIDRVLHIIAALPIVANQLTKRRKEKDKDVPRSTLHITDEYDVQDLLQSLLLIDFSDVRNEEWTPSFAGASMRTDFLLHDEEIVIEVKKTRDSLKQKEVVNELTIDIAAYKTHPRAKHLVCVVWDLDKILTNPSALKKDLEQSSAGFATIVVLT